MKMDFSSFLDSWSNELLAQSNRVRQLIGSAHWLSDGHHKETILRNFLQQYLPKSLEVGSGFIISNDGNQGLTSPEIDILISSFERACPYLSNGNFTVVPPDSVMAHIEVKTNLAKATLKDSLDKTFLTRRLLPNLASKPWGGIIFYNSDLDSSRACELIEKEIAPRKEEITKLLPICICLTGTCIAFIENDGARVRLRSFETAEKSLALALIDMLSSVRHNLGGSIFSDIDDLATSCLNERPIIKIIK